MHTYIHLMNTIGDDARANTQQVVNEIKKFGDLFEKAIELHLCSVLRIKSVIQSAPHRVIRIYCMQILNVSSNVHFHSIH